MPVEALLRYQGRGECVERRSVLRQYLACPLCLLVQDARDLLVDMPRRLVRVLTGVDQVLTQEDRPPWIPMPFCRSTSDIPHSRTMRPARSVADVKSS